jgi:hypothetical protein
VTGTVCMPCWLAYDPDKHKEMHEHPARKCRVRWVEKGEVTVCMCRCARLSDDVQPEQPPTTSDDASRQTP